MKVRQGQEQELIGPFPNKTNTPLDLHVPRGKFIPAPTCQKYVLPDLAKVLPGYSHSKRRLTFVSPTAKQ